MPSALRDATELLAQLYQMQGNYQLAYENLQLFRQMTDSLLNLENQEKATRQGIQYEFEKEKNQIDLENQRVHALEQQKL